MDLQDKSQKLIDTNIEQENAIKNDDGATQGVGTPPMNQSQLQQKKIEVQLECM